MVAAGQDLFVANGYGGGAVNGSVTELNPSTGAPVRVVLGSADYFDTPDAMVPDGRDLLVANGNSGSATELSAQNGAASGPVP
jgi:hypothetical protein